jgi:hypothetical protein
VERACANLDVAPWALTEMVCTSAGIALPAEGTVARDVVDAVIGWVAALPAGATDDPRSHPFSNALAISPGVVTAECRRVFARMQELVTGMERAHLRDVAVGLGIRIEDVEKSQFMRLDERGPRESGSSGEAAALAVTAPESWTPGLLKALRRGVCTRLAGIGDALLDLSEWQPRQLNWTPAADGDGFTAICAVDGAPQPLLLTLTPDPYTPAAGLGRSRQVAGYGWEIGWDEPDGAFNREWSGHAPSYETARYQAGVLAQFRPETDRLRAWDSRRLFRPRDPADADAAETRTLGSFLQSTQHYRLDPVNFDSKSWPARPHRTADSPRNSALANLFWMNWLAWPDDPDAAPSSPEFAEFLLAQGVRLDPPTLTYLTHLDDPGVEPVPWEDRHTAGMQAVVARHDNPPLEFALHSERSITVPASEVLTLDQLDGVERRCRELRHQEAREREHQVAVLAHQTLRAVVDGQEDEAARLLDRIACEVSGEGWAVAITTLRKLRGQWLTPSAAGTDTLWPPADLRAGHRDAVRLLPRPQRPAAITAADQWQAEPGYPDDGQWRPGTNYPDQADFCAAVALLAWMARRAQAADISLPWREPALTEQSGMVL